MYNPQLPSRSVLARYFHLFLFLFCAICVYKNLTLSDTPSRFKILNNSPIVSGYCENLFTIPSATYLIKVQLPIETPLLKVSVNGQALSLNMLGQRHHSTYVATYFTLPRDLLKSENNILSVSGAGKFNGLIKVDALQYVGHVKENIYILFSDFITKSCSSPREDCLPVVTLTFLIISGIIGVSILFLRAKYFILTYSWLYLLAISIIFPVNGLRVYISSGLFLVLLFISWLIAFSFGLKHLFVDAHSIDKYAKVLHRCGLFTHNLLTVPTMFVFLCGILGLYYLFVYIYMRRMPLGHDTWSYMQMHYIFLNDAVKKGEIPLWFPYMTKGTVSNVWLYLQNNFLANIYYVIAPILVKINDYYLFYLSMYADEIVFGVGMLLLSLKLYSTRWAVIFTTVSSVFSVIWGAQIWFNLRLYYLLPFIFYFFLEFIKTASWRYFFLLLLMFPLSMFGNVPYFISVLSLVAFLFYALVIIFMWKDIKNRLIPSLTKNGLAMPLLKCTSAIFVSGSLTGLVYYCVKYAGAEAIHYANVARAASGRVEMQDFLTYGGDISFAKFVALFTGYTTNVDQMLYSGTLVMVFFAAYLYYWIRKNSVNKLAQVFFIVFVLMLSFTTGGVFSKIAYYLWPTMTMFRHIGLVGGILRILIILLSAYGLDVFARRVAEGDLKIRNDFQVLFFITLTVTVLKVLIIWQKKIYFPAFSPIMFPSVLMWDFLIAGMFLSVLAIFIPVYRRLRHVLNLGVIILPVVLFLHLIDIVTYRFVQDSLFMPIVSQKTVDLFKFQDYSYISSRKQTYFENNRFSDFYSENARGYPAHFAPFVKMDKKGNLEWNESLSWPYGSSYWSWDSFFYFDACYTAFRTDHRLKVLSDFYSCYIKKFIPFNLESPMPSHPSFSKMVACGFPKLQVFKKIYIVPEKTPLKSLLTSENYKGDILFSQQHFISKTAVEYDGDMRAVLPRNERVNAAVKVETFSLNKIELIVNNPLDCPAILFYSDAWHKNWKAYVNGEQKHIYQANLAFKAVEIPKGVSRVQFSFQPLTLIITNHILIWFNIFMFIILILIGLRCCFPFFKKDIQ